MGHVKIAVVGAGPSGIAASIQLRRYGLDADLFEKDEIGGLLWNANLVENYPGFPGGISGPDLVGLMKKQLKEHQITVRNSEVLKIDHIDGNYSLSDFEGKYKYEYVVVATGTKPKLDKMIGDAPNRNHIHYDIRKLLGIKSKTIVIVGGGDAAFDQAINISRSNDIIIINRGKEMKCLPLLSDRAFQNPRIIYLGNTYIKHIEDSYNSGGKFEKLKLNLLDNQQDYWLECDELVYAIGRVPQIEFIEPKISHKGLYFVGDVHNGFFRQTSIAVGEGVMAAMKIHESIMCRS